MASRLTNQFLSTLQFQTVLLEGSFQIGASGVVAPSTGLPGSGLQSVTRVGTGSYQLQLQDGYNRLLGFDAMALPGSSGAGPVTDGSLSVGTAYQIVFASTSTNWVTLGLPRGLTPAAGMPFVATSGASNGPLGSSGVTAAGNGVVIPLRSPGIAAVQLLPNYNTELRSSTAGAYLFVQTLNTSLAAADPTSGTVIRYNIWLRNSSVLGKGETSTNY